MSLSTGIKLPGTAAAINNGGTAITNINNIKLVDSVFATCAISGIGSTSQDFSGSNYGFTIPLSPAVTITGAQITAYGAKSSVGGFLIRNAGLVLSGAETGVPLGDYIQPVTTVATDYTFGGDGIMFGTDIKTALSSSTFGAFVNFGNPPP